MQVILLQRIEKLGQIGTVVSVKPGYARNFLLPRKKALRATKENIAYFEAQRTHLEAMNLQRRQEAEEVAEKMAGLMITLVRQASETGQLYGAIRSLDVVNSLTEQGVKITRHQVILPMPIKTLGIHQAHISLHPEVTVPITINIALSEEEAAQQIKQFNIAKPSVSEAIKSAEI